MPTIVNTLAFFRRFYSDPDIWMGAILIVFGAGATYLAIDFDPRSRTFPLIISLILTLCGLVIFLRSFFSDESRALPINEFGAIALAVVVVILWGGALSVGIGFGLSTFFLMLGMLWLGGVCRLSRALMISIFITLVTYGLFVLVLNVRLPKSFLSFIAPGL
ncbi:tripartite tricarboxylate transporter TctB family protein [Vreelandella arcis]|uniref:Tripartite tricarboxylate transporter TctB family protein n=1 Tax=Vreelandella arcis TaxID=416873 RepID=A0A1H0BJG7_9GAMM|nr:tripartite tricarboxylate transporter TctB family protein [Halomonas arcis]SDN45789.1 Tripartite tricarboxylate transporter TctB family protein [Halomonas arcis]